MSKPQGEVPPTSPITRESLASGALLRQVRAHPGAGPMLTEAERAARFEALMATIPADADVWLFAYGSMLWNPTVHHIQSSTVRVVGWHRSFCLRSTYGRGSPEQPGLMLAIESGGHCDGLAYCLAAATVRAELHLLWQREMVSGAYHARWLDGRLGDGRDLKLIAFVVDPDCHLYECPADEAQQAARIAAACGMLGSNRDYLERTAQTLLVHGLSDPYVERLMRALGPRTEPLLTEKSASAPGR
jgi:glutathione-specific gamma-glutamylcyclotransferase